MFWFRGPEAPSFSIFLENHFIIDGEIFTLCPGVAGITETAGNLSSNWPVIGKQCHDQDAVPEFFRI
jgi:hypothetical protein